jgi:hypothetical protein
MSRAAALALLAAAAGCGKGSGAGGTDRACMARFDRMEAILTAPYDRVVNERILPFVKTADGHGRVDGAIAIEVSRAEPPTIRVGSGAAIDWRFGGANPEVLAEVERLRAATPDAPIVFDVPSHVEAWGAAQLIEQLSAKGPVRIAISEEHLDIAPDAPAWLAAELRGLSELPVNERAPALARAIGRAGGACHAQIEAALATAREPRDPSGEDDRIITAVVAAARACDCRTFDPIGVAVGFRVVLASGKLGWIELRADPASTTKLELARKNERFGELVERVMKVDAAARRAGVDLGPK